MPRMEVCCSRLGRDDGDVVGQGPVQCLRRPLDGRAAVDVGADDVAEGMHTCVGAPGDAEVVERCEDRSQCLTHCRLDGAQLGLCRPSVEGRAVVLER
jgi:hypothetical protein